MTHYTQAAAPITRLCTACGGQPGQRCERIDSPTPSDRSPAAAHSRATAARRHATAARRHAHLTPDAAPPRLHLSATPIFPAYAPAKREGCRKSGEKVTNLKRGRVDPVDKRFYLGRPRSKSRSTRDIQKFVTFSPDLRLQPSTHDPWAIGEPAPSLARTP